MTIRWRRAFFLIPFACATASCQPELHSGLATGPIAYNQIAVSSTDSVNALILFQPGDTIGVNVFGEPDLNTPAIVIDPAGKISLPLIGEEQAAGLSTSQLANKLQAAYDREYLRDARVNVVLVKSAPRVVSVEGQVKTPGVFEVQQGYTLLTALALAGSPLETAKLNEVLVFRTKDGQRVGGRFDITEIRAGRSPDPAVLPGDVIVVGYSQVRGVYLDFLRTAPLIGAFSRY